MFSCPSRRSVALLLFSSAVALGSARAVDAQKRRLARESQPPTRLVERDLGGGILPTSGDSPLTPLASFAGRVGIFAEVLSYDADSVTAGVFSVAGIPSGAEILAAWVHVTTFTTLPDVAVQLTFAGVAQGARPADAVDVDHTYRCSAFRFDVTGLVTGNGAYAYQASAHFRGYGDSLTVIYEHPCLPLRTIAIHDGAESLQAATSVTTFAGLPAGTGRLLLFTQADDDASGGSESVVLDGVTVAGPGDVFDANAGPYASLVDLPVTTSGGDQVLEVTTGPDWFGFHLAALSVAGVDDTVTIDFETDDGGNALANGQDIQFGDEFGNLLDIDGYPSIGLRAAIFDSTPGGPNDPSQDRDLLVDLGNLLILQGQPAQSVPGIYDRPNDDANGGYFSIEFRQPVRACSLDLVDIDPGADYATVISIDGNGRRRTHVAPGGFTEDLLVNGGPAYRTLDLSVLCPQPGYLSSATATEELGFDPDDVRTLQVVLGGSGAIDNLVITPSSFPHAIDFEDLALAPDEQINSFQGIQSGGFVFEHTDSSSIQDVHAGNQVLTWSWNGTAVLAGHLEVRMRRADGGPFTLERFDFAGWPQNMEGPLSLLASNGAWAGVAPDGIADGVGGPADFETFTLPPEFADVTSVTFMHDEPAFGFPFALDNLHVRADELLSPFVVAPPATAAPVDATDPALPRGAQRPRSLRR